MGLTKPLQACGASRGGARGISLVVPTYNEAQNLPELLARIGSAFRGQEDLEPEVLIADDASPDGTAEAALRLASELAFPLRVISRSGPRSLSLSVLAAARAARHAVIVVLDADLSHSPDEAPALARSIVDEGFDVAIASRYALGGAIRGWPLRRRLLSAAGTRLARHLQGRKVPVRDPLSGYFACRRELLLEPMGTAPAGFKVLLHILLARPDLGVLELPSSFQDRRCGASKLGLRQDFEFLSQVVRCLFERLACRLLRFRSLFLKLPTRRSTVP